MSVVCMVASEILLEAATSNTGSLTGVEVGLLLGLTDCIACCTLAKILGATFMDQQDLIKESPWEFAQHWKRYPLMALLMFFGTSFGNIAVAWVQYPVKVVIKSSKLIPTMVVASVVGNSRGFARRDYAAAMLVCAGTAAFSYHSGRSGATVELVALGLFLLMVSLISDVAAVNAHQWFMQRGGVAAESMILRQNFCCAIIILVAISWVSSWATVFSAVLEQPRMLGCLVLLGATSAGSVVAQMRLIREAGSVVSVGVSTGRKLLTIVLSYIVFPKPISSAHTCGILLVAAGLSIPIFGKSSGQRRSSTSEDAAAVLSDASAASAAAAAARRRGVRVVEVTSRNDAEEDLEAPAVVAASPAK